MISAAVKPIRTEADYEAILQRVESLMDAEVGLMVLLSLEMVPSIFNETDVLGFLWRYVERLGVKGN